MRNEKQVMINKKHDILNMNSRLLKTIVALMMMAVGTTTVWGQNPSSCDITVAVDNTSAYTPTQIANGDFSTRPFMPFKYNNTWYNTWDAAASAYTPTEAYWTEVNPNGIGKGWNTTETQVFEHGLFEWINHMHVFNNILYNNGNNAGHDFFLEMNACNSAVLYQDLPTNGHDVIRWSLDHAVRLDCGANIQSVRVEVGAPEYSGANIVAASGVNNDVNSHIQSSSKVIYRSSGITNPSNATYGFNGSNLGKLSLSQTASSDNASWHTVTGVYVIPSGQAVTRFGFIAEVESDAGCGNLLDNLTFSTLIGNMTATYGTNNSVIISGYWGEENPSKKLIVQIGETALPVDMTSVTGQNFTITISEECLGGTVSSVVVYHQDYPGAETTISINQPISVSAADVNTVYDGVHSWGITAVVTEPTSGYTLTYGTSYNDCNSAVSPTFMEPGTHYVYYTVSAPGYTTEKRKATVFIDKLPFPSEVVITPPTPVEGLTYDKTKHTLISAGSATGGYTMVYALGTDGNTAPTEGWSTSLPEAKWVGNYYVWYKVLGGDLHKDSEPTYVIASITSPGLLTLDLAVNNAAWGTIETQSTIYANDFETGTFDLPEGWTNDDLYSWIVGQKDNTYCLKSGNYNVASSSSSLQATYDFASNGTISFRYRISSESNYDKGYFKIDGSAKINGISGDGQWTDYSIEVTAGTHTFEWRYEKDGSVNNNDDAFYIDDIVIIENRPDITTSVQGISGDKFLVTAIPSSDDDYFVNWTSNNVVVSTEPTYMITLTETTELTANFQNNFEGSGTADDPYLIHSLAAWNHLATKVNSGTNYAGKYFRQTADIGTAQEPVTHMVGIYSSTQSENRLFSGTYDGKGHTLTFSYGAAEAYGNEDHVAPFRHVGGENAQTPARIQNLHVTGHIYTSTKYAAGIIAQNGSWVNMENCRSSMVIHSSVGGDGSHGGLVGGIDGTLSITGCAFDGKLLSTGTTATNSCGGFIGWNGGSTLSITNSLYAPATIDTEHGENEVNASSSATFSRNGASITNCYYTRVLNTMQGELAYSVTGGTGVTVAAVGEPTPTYDVSELDFYGSNGFAFNGVRYGGSGDVVSLNLTHGDAPTGYSFSHYSVNSGTLSGTDNPYSLTMPANNVTVDATYSINTYTLTLTADGYGNVAVNTPLPSGVTNNNNGTYTVNYGTEVTLTATPAADYHFVQWQDDNSDNPRTITVTDDATYTATFAINEYRLDSIRTTWQVKIGDATPIFPTPYVTENPSDADTMGYVMIPLYSEFVIIPSSEQKPLINKLELIEPILDLSTVTTDTIVPNGWTITGTLGVNKKISIAAGATVTLDNATIQRNGGYGTGWAGITCLGDATIILKDGTTNTVKHYGDYYPGIFVPGNHTLTIQGNTGFLSVRGEYGAAIGSGTNDSGTYASCGDIVINGGIINTSNHTGAGIGCGDDGVCGDIIITGGTITTSAPESGAGIGSSGSGSCGDITISGGTIHAQSHHGAGIGCSESSGGSCGTITISGGDISAISLMGGAGIGCGSYSGSCGNITISGGSVHANSEYGAGIGSGSYSGSCGNIIINGGSVIAQSMEGAGIGGGASGSCGNIVINGGTVNARSEHGAGIGGGSSSACGDITITSGVTQVTATTSSMEGYHSIGKGYSSNACGTVTIGGTVYYNGSSYQNGGDTYLATKPLIYSAHYFSVSGTKQVIFALGNLQATYYIYSSNFTSWSWAFATRQWDYIGNAAGNTSINGNGTASTNNVTVDLFGWVGNSSSWSYWDSQAAMYGISNSTTDSNYGNVAGESLKSNWGNAIGTGWRTLTSDEWVYLFNTRTVNGGTGSGHSYTLGQSVNGVLGLVIYPDNYTGSVYAGSDWSTFEAAGCVFLPAAGDRDGVNIFNASEGGYYWSSSSHESSTASSYCFWFNSSSLAIADAYNRHWGLSVRLVRDAE